MAQFLEALGPFLALSRAKQAGIIFGSGIFYAVSKYVFWRFREKSSAFNAYTTNQEAINGLDLTGKIALVTGANNGIGLETARTLVQQGCRVIMACRSIDKAETAKKDILDSLNLNDNNSNNLEVMALDLSSLASVTEFSKQFNTKNLKIDYLINNAGIMALPAYKESKEGYELQFATNHLGHFLLTHLLMPSLLMKSDIKSDRLPRVINLSSSAHRLPSNYNWCFELFEDCIESRNFMGDKRKDEYGAWLNYGISKTSNILFARELQKRFNNELISVSLHPGGVSTGLSKHMAFKDALVFLKLVFFTPSFLYKNMKSKEQGAATTLRCVSLDDNEIKKGHFYANCQSGHDNGMLKSVGKESLNDGGKIAEKLWELSQVLIQEKGFSLTP